MTLPENDDPRDDFTDDEWEAAKLEFHGCSNKGSLSRQIGCRLKGLQPAGLRPTRKRSPCTGEMCRTRGLGVAQAVD
jgi:hypothetical protein